MSGYPNVILTEEGMREGMQIEDANIPVNLKIELLDALSDTGLKNIVVGSFVNPKWVPQMARIEELLRGFHPRSGVNYTAVALNDKGIERAREFTPPLSQTARKPGTLVHLCDVFAQRNTNRSQAQEIAAWPGLIERAKANGAREASIGLVAAWGSNWVGEFSHEERMSMLRRQWQLWADAGIRVTRIMLLDPMGWNMPHQVKAQMRIIKDQWPDIHDFWLHLHDTRGVALASSFATLEVLDPADTLRLDASIGGMAGCPYCGNGRGAPLVATEDMVHLLEGMGIPTGVDLKKLIQVVWRAEEIVGHPLYGHVSKAGPRPGLDERYPMDMPFVETLDEARHFMTGPGAYANAPSPWKEPITSWQRPDSARPGQNGHSPLPAKAAIAAC